MANARIERDAPPPPPPAKVVLEMSEPEARALHRLLEGGSWYTINNPTVDDPQFGIFGQGRGILNHMEGVMRAALPQE